VGVDLPIRVSFTSGAGVAVVFSDITGAVCVVKFVSFNTIVSDGIPKLGKYWLINNSILLPPAGNCIHKRDITIVWALIGQSLMKSLSS
jgi:hypothetical protein